LRRKSRSFGAAPPPPPSVPHKSKLHIITILLQQIIIIIIFSLIHSLHQLHKASILTSSLVEPAS
jgi:hypothetical protein